MDNILSREEVQKLDQQKRFNGPRWFQLSYDAGQEIRAEMLNEKKEKVIVTKRRYVNDDFRKVIIRTLREAQVVKMEEPVETGIWFLDPRENLGADKKLAFWKKKFDAYGADFYYCITASLQKNNVVPFYDERPNKTLQKNFQELLKQVIKEEIAKKKS